MSLLSGLHRKGHVVVIDNYFFSVELFTQLASIETYATCTIQANCIGLSHALKSLKNFNHVP